MKSTHHTDCSLVLSASLLAFGALTLPACGNGVSTDFSKPTSRDTESEERFEDTIVHLREDGTVEVRHAYSTQKQREAQAAAREALQRGEALPGARKTGPNVGTVQQAISFSAECGDFDLWMFDQPYMTGNRI